MTLEVGWTRMRHAGQGGKAGAGSGGRARAAEHASWLRRGLRPDGSPVERILKGGWCLSEENLV